MFDDIKKCENFKENQKIFSNNYRKIVPDIGGDKKITHQQVKRLPLFMVQIWDNRIKSMIEVSTYFLVIFLSLLCITTVSNTF